MTTPKKPADHLPKSLSADAEPKVVEFKGENFTVPALNDLPFSFLADLENGAVASATKSVLGAEQYDTFLALDPSIKEFTEFFEQISGDAGN